jgi:hypothetical protein
MRAFFERNKPVFTIGLITLVVFLGLILSYELKSHNNLTGLKKIGSDSSAVLTEEEIVKEQEAKQASESAQSQAQAEAQTDATLGIVNIEFANSGWVPILVDVAKNQKVVWTNKTDKEILLRQRTPTYDSFTEPVKIEPGKSYEMRMTVIGDWNYDESQSNYFATIRVF